VAGSCEYSDEPAGSGAMELVKLVMYDYRIKFLSEALR
jgi:hypothetical protein